MTEEQKKKIRRMRLDGFGYKYIATTLVLPLSTVKGYCKRNGLIGIGPVVAMNNEVSVQLGLICKNCGKRLKHTAGKKKKTFPSGPLMEKLIRFLDPWSLPSFSSSLYTQIKIFKIYS